MSDDSNARAGRLMPAKKKGPNAGALAAVALITGLGVGGAGVVYLQSQKTEQQGPVLDTSNSLEFQEESNAGLRTVITPAPVLTQTERGPSEEETALRARVTELEALIAEVRNAQVPTQQAPVTPAVETVVDTTQIDALTLRLDELSASIADREAALTAALAERDNLSREAVRKDAELQGLETRLAQSETEALDEMKEAEAQAERLRELERRRSEAEAIREAQINSPIDGLSGGSSGGEGREYTGDEAFIRAGSEAISPTQSRIIGSPSNTVMQGTVIEATLTTGINSQLSGTITSTVSYDIWSFDMRRVLIPRGSQMFGRYSNEVALGQERVLVAWDRVVTPNGQVVDLEAYGSDRLGRSGLTGRVDTRFGQRFGAAAAVSVFSALPALAASRSEDEATSEVAEQIGTDARDATSSIVEKYLSLAPVITVEHGDVIMVMVTNDLELF